MNYVSIWDLTTLEQTGRIAQQSSVISACDVHEDRNRLATGGVDGSLKIWDLKTGKLISTLQKDGAENGWIGWSPDGKKLAASDT